MTRKLIFSIAAASLYLLVFLILVWGNYPTGAAWMFFFSPVVILWMAYTIIRHGIYTGTELEADEEWGYEDRDKSTLGVF